jgi:hypothetical protein
MALVDVGADRRAGILTQAGVLAALAKPQFDSPVFRGLFVLQYLMCEQMPPPPPDVPPLADPKAGDPPRTTRQRQEQSHSPPTCAACHKRIDGIGFGFEHYDAVGHWRTQDNGVPVDATGEFVGTLDMDGKFDGAVDMARKLAGSAQVRACAATQWFRYAFGRIETPDDACALAPLVDAFEASRGDMKALVVSIATSDAFRFRQVTP